MPKQTPISAEYLNRLGRTLTFFRENVANEGQGLLQVDVSKESKRLAERTDFESISNSYISGIEAGNFNPTVSIIRTLVRLYNLSPSQLYNLVMGYNPPEESGYSKPVLLPEELPEGNLFLVPDNIPNEMLVYVRRLLYLAALGAREEQQFQDIRDRVQLEQQVDRAFHDEHANNNGSLHRN